MPQFFNIEWLDACGQRSYPLAEHATKKDRTNSIAIPDSFLVELYLPIAASAELAADAFYIKFLSILGGGYTLDVAYDDRSGDPPVVATCSISKASFHENTRYALVGLGNFDDTVGKVVIGRLSDIDLLPAGVYRFDPDGSALDPDAIRPIVRGLSSLSISQGGVQGPRLRNNVILSAGAGIRLTTTVAPNRDPEIRIDAIPGEGFTSTCDCVVADTPCIRTINGIAGDARQNFTLLGDNCLTLSPITSGLKLADTCCQPCCGATELAEIVRVLRNLENSVSTLENYNSRLSTQVQELQTNVISSKIGAGTVSVSLANRLPG